MDDSGQIVEPAIPSFSAMWIAADRRATRLDLANWLVSPKNPLTARVYMNRMWSEFFGTGISKSVEDLGSQGDWPSHLELLNWLAAEFMNPQYDAAGTHPWDIRHMVRIIVLSDTYRQSSLSSPELDQRDPDNRLLARQSRFRVDAESVHDLMLEISGLLVNKFGGPSVNPISRKVSGSIEFSEKGLVGEPQRGPLPARHLHLLAAHIPASDDDEFRRSDARRMRGEPREFEHAAAGARSAQRSDIRGGGAGVWRQDFARGREYLQSQIAWAFQQATGRRPENDEIAVLVDLHAKSLTHFKADPAGTAEYLKIGDSAIPAKDRLADLAAMTNVARVIMNLHEVITRD